MRRVGGPAFALIAVAVAALIAGGAVSSSAAENEATAAAGERPAPGASDCRGAESLGGFFKLKNGQQIATNGVGCAVARAVVRGFPESCAGAFAAQGRCSIRTRGLWRCRSRIVGPATKGAPSKQRCRRGRARLSFVVAYFPPTERISAGAEASGAAAAAVSSPYNEAGRCVNTAFPATSLTPPLLTGYEIRVTAGVPITAGADVQQALVNRGVYSALGRGLGSSPRNSPNRIPIFLTPRDFDAAGDKGITASTCSDRSIDAIVARADASDRASTVAHELFHAHSYWGIAGGAVEVPWFEEAAAAWAEGKVGFPEPPNWDYLLQYPLPLDRKKPTAYPYAMSRFVQFLDDKGLVSTSRGYWPLIQEVVDQYSAPGATLGLSGSLVSRNTTLGEQLAAFWGDRIRDKPAHGPQLQPSRANARLIEVKPGSEVYKTPAERLDTTFLNFTLADNVRRVEFEFDAPALGYFWGAPTEKTSQRYFDEESVSFCVGGSDTNDLKWPIRFPVTFTNGGLGEATRTGKITVRAQSDPEQCRIPALNRACRVLRLGGVRQVIGPGRFPFASESRQGGFRSWLCFYNGRGGEVNLNLARFEGRTSKQVRQAAARQIDQLGFREVRAGDLAGVGVVPGDPNPAVGLVMAVGREIAFFIVGPGTDPSRAIRLARGVAGEI